MLSAIFSHELGIALGLSLLIGIIKGDGQGERREYCQLDTFKASCPPGHVIMMTEAHYGRMRMGRCLPRDFTIGCKADVLSIMESKCSGRRKCQVSIPDKSLVAAMSCPRDMVAYLEASYTCIQVFSASPDFCQHGEVVLNESSGYLAVPDPDPNRSSPADCRFHLNVKEGQHISITLFDYMAAPGAYMQDQQQCTLYGTVFEGDKKPTICSGNQRERIAHTSTSNHVIVQLNDVNFRAANQSYFLLKFKAESCPNPPPLEDAHMVRRGDQLDVICNKTVRSQQRSWHLVCKDTAWVGVVDNCSAEHSAEWNTPSGKKGGGGLQFPHGMVVAVIIGVALGVLIGFLLLFFIYAARRRSQKQQQQRWPREGKALLYDANQGEYASKGPGDPSRAPPPSYRADLAQRFIQHSECDDSLAIPMGHIPRSQGAHGVHVYETTATPGGSEERTVLRGSFSCDCDSRCDSGLGLNPPSSGPSS